MSIKLIGEMILGITVLSSGLVFSQSLSPNGMSGSGVVPDARTIKPGDAVISFDPTMPGASLTKGYNTQIGLGLYENFELVGRLATNNQKCNMFVTGNCPDGNIRDFSASLKWSITNNWLKENNANLAFGVTDFGGAANYFKSYYAVASKEFGPFEFTAGQAKGVSENALLKGAFGSVTYRPLKWLDVNLQKVGSNTFAVATLKKEIPHTQASAYVTLNQRLNGAEVTEKKWVGLGVSLPLDQTKDRKITESQNSNKPHKNKSVPKLNPEDLYELLQLNGFYRPRVTKQNKLLKIEIENTAYAWNTIDAIGPALLALASTHGNLIEQNFEITITSRGISHAVVTGDAVCLRRWIELGDVCSNLSIRSGLQRAGTDEKFKFFSSNDHVNFENWLFRPELIISPALLSSIGTEYGSFDMDAGININLLLPLWTGASIETNRIEPLGMSTKGFEQGGAFYESRLKPIRSRTLVHQLLNAQAINTQVRMSVGTAYTNWGGHQIETSTQSDDGRQRLGLTSGRFKNDTQSIILEKSYQLATYRYAYDDGISTQTEITTGKYWGGDRGWSIGQKFWHGDTALNLYLRRTRMTESAPIVSFAGIQISIPITPRVNKGMQNMGIRGTNQWTYTLESRIFDKENLITGGYGEVPRMGESLMQTFNRDRNSTRYLENNLVRIKSTFNELSDSFSTADKP